MKNFLFSAVSIAVLSCLLVALALIWGGPGTPAPMQSINDPFESVDFSTLPPLKNYKGADGSTLYFREYVPAAEEPNGSAVLIHGSSASSNSLHPMATALAAAGIHVYALDVRGHGASGQSQELQGIVQSAGKDWPVQLLPGIQHIPLTLEPAALKAIAELVQKLHAI